MNQENDKINVLVVFEESPERVLFFRTKMNPEEYLRAKKAHGTFINSDENEDTQWLYSQFFNEDGQQITESLDMSTPISMGSCWVVHFGLCL